jgi:curved DNA-binding protein CbpA
MTMDAPHAALGLPASASPEEITRAYRKLARRYPPELTPEQFARIHGAYQVLTSLERRMEAAQSSPEETLGQLFAASAALKPPPAAPPPLTDRDLEPVLAPFRRALLVRRLRESFADPPS